MRSRSFSLDSFREENWAIADAMSLTREQIEKVYVVALLLEDPRRWTVSYLKDDWRRRYERFLLERDEHSGLKRYERFYEKAFSDEIESERTGLGITAIEQEYVEWEYRKRPGESVPDEFKEARKSMGRFPTPGRAAASWQVDRAPQERLGHLRRLALGHRRRQALGAPGELHLRVRLRSLSRRGRGRRAVLRYLAGLQLHQLG
jgi:hypothetical protein